MALSKLYTIIVQLDICFTSLIILFSILSMIYYNTSDYSYLTQISDNWNANLLFPLDNQNCNPKEKSVKLGEWAGITYACDCSSDPFSLFQIYLRTCKLEIHEMAACRNIDEVKPIDYYKWRLINFCRSSEMNMNYRSFFENKNTDYSLRKDKNSCPNNSRSCGEVDSVNNVLCVSNKKNCPINYLKFFVNEGEVPKDGKNYTIAKGDGGIFAFSGDYTDQNIVIDFKISDGLPCASPYYYSDNSTSYILEYSRGKDSCKKQIGETNYDERFKLIDSYSFKEITTQNGVWNIISNLPKYPDEKKNKQTSLYYRNYIGIRTKCLEDLRMNQLGEKFYDEMTNMKSDLSYLIILINSGCILAIIYSITNIIITSMVLSKEDYTLKLGCSVIILLLFSIPILILHIIAVSQIQLDDKKTILGDIECVDKLTYNAGLNYFDKSAKAAGFIISMIIFFILNTLSDLIKYFYGYKLNPIHNNSELIGFNSESVTKN